MTQTIPEDATHERNGVFYKRYGHGWAQWTSNQWVMCFGDQWSISRSVRALSKQEQPK